MTKKKIKTVADLIEHQFIQPENAAEISEVVSNFSLAITHEMHRLIDKKNPADPIAKQFVPTVLELNFSEAERKDPIGDNAHTRTKGIIHRYPDRCLFTPVHVCPVYCRFCFRREKIGNGSETLTPDEMDKAFDYINSHSEIWEVILTGGDPFILKPAFLKKIITQLNAISHVEIIRIHTRVPVVDPDRISSAMIHALSSDKSIYVMLHANHPNEFTPNAIAACRKLIQAGIPMLSQTVLLKNLNNNIEVLSELMRCFVRNKIKPYYLHHCDLAKGTKQFRTSIQEGQQLVQALRGRFSGICQPTYVLDIPGGFGKVPIGPNYISFAKELENKNSEYIVEDYLGCKHVYVSESE